MGNHRLKECSVVRIFLGIFALFSTAFCAAVYRIDPNRGSLGGHTTLTVYGSGFAADNFLQNDDSNYGNKVYLVTNSGLQVTCEVELYGSTESQIICITPKHMPPEGHFVKVTVNGVTIDDSDLCGGNPTSYNCQYTPSSSYTPTITSLTPQSGLPGSFVKLTGRIWTNLYGANINASTYGPYPSLLKVNVGSDLCDLKNGNEFYGFSVSCSGTSCNDGSIKCRAKETTVGYYNASFIVENPYGESLPDDSVYRVSATDKIYMYQIYTDITRISPNQGSKKGGLTLTIYGNHFDGTSSYAAFVGGTECSITKVVFGQYVECTVAPEPLHNESHFAGNRGVVLESWPKAPYGNELDRIMSMNDTDQGYMRKFLDDAYYSDQHSGEYRSYKMSTFFKPPHDGEYSLQIGGYRSSSVYMDGVNIWSGYQCTECKRMNLTSSNQYLLQVVTYGSSSSQIKVSTKYHDSHLTSAWTTKAVQEKQQIRINSQSVREMQELTFNGFFNSTLYNDSYTKEVQVVDITSTGLFRLGLFGVYTEPLSVSADEVTIQHMFNALPVFATGENVSVERNLNTSANVSFTFTFESKLGDFPDIELKTFGDNPDLIYNVTELTKGVPNVEYATLTFDGIMSEPFSVISLDQYKLKRIVEGLFDARCPDDLSGKDHAFLFESYEDYSSYFDGTLSRETEPFCGQYSLKNPKRLFTRSSVPISRYNQICFAYKGLIENNIWLNYRHRDIYNYNWISNTSNFHLTFKRDSSIRSTTWYYTCFDMMSHLRNKHPAATDFQLYEAWIRRALSDSDIYVDALVIGSRQTLMNFDEVNLRRRPAAMPIGSAINYVYVSRATDDTFTITFQTASNCGHQFPLLGLGNSQLINGSVSYPSDAAEFNLGDGETGRLSVKRLSHASPPISGMVDVEFKGNTRTGLSISFQDTQFERELESLPGTGGLSISKSGRCDYFYMDITFMNPGDQPEIKISNTNLTGIDAYLTVSTHNDGGLLYMPLSGDMLSTVHDKPQVSLFINKVPTKCSGDCSFEWSDEITPTVTSVTPNVSVSSTTSIVIVGSGFDTEPSHNTVIIGGTECVISSSTNSSISCYASNGPLGAHKIIVNVDGKGFAYHVGSDITFTYSANITSISPLAGSQGGGTILTVNGYGFGENVVVFIGKRKCSLVNIAPTNITCYVPPSESAGTVNVTLDIDSINYIFNGFTYDALLTPMVNSIDPSTIGVAGGIITINGSNLGKSGTVHVGGVTGEIITYTTNQVKFKIFGLKPGVHEINVGGKLGHAILSASQTNNASFPVLFVELTVNNVFPLVGSIKGGTRLTITGVGFGNDSAVVDVAVGDVTCTTESVTNTEIVCLIVDTGKVHNVTNSGTHRAYGVFYAFDKPHLKIERGDYVKWTWVTPSFVNDIKHAIIEVESLNSRVAKPGGFSSGTPSRNGNFQYQFNDVGTFYVWSGYVDIYDLKNYAGQIDVVEKLSSLNKVAVEVNGIESTYLYKGSPVPVDSSSCPSNTSAIPGCSDAKPTGGDSNCFNFAFWNCSTPEIKEIVPNQGTTKTVITISGKGFSTVHCQNEIQFSDTECTVISSNESVITCSIDKSTEPALGVYHPISMRVKNRGKALVQIDSPANRSFGVIPNIEDFSPKEGSLAGDTKITISGFGFGSSVLVQVGNQQCNVIEATYSQIICTTPSKLLPLELDIGVHVMVNGLTQSAVCETDNKVCKYTYSESLTPTVTAINIESVSNATDFTITGTNLGNDTSDIEVYIGTELASLISSNGTHLVAMIQNVPVGNNAVFVRHTKMGKAHGDLKVSGTPAISNLAPNTGSIYGGTKITVTGNGFIKGDTVVKIGGRNCHIIYVSLSEVVCTTPGGTAGLVSVSVISKSVAYPQQIFEYARNSTPEVSSVFPQFGLPGDTVNISGTNLEGDNVTVRIDDVPCIIESESFSHIECVVGAHATGLGPVYVHVGGLGQSNTNITFAYTLNITDIKPTQGGIAGGQIVTLTGKGFSDDMTVTICGFPCRLQTSNATTFYCRTPAFSEQICDVKISTNGLHSTLKDAYNYNETLTPTISDVTPKRGGTGGGTKLTVSGSGFGNNSSEVTVRIDGSACNITTVTNTQIICETGPHSGSVKAYVEVEVAGNGIAKEQSTSDLRFFYIDVWSSYYTWGGAAPPAEGEFVVVPENQTLLLDTNTPVLSFLLIKGGRLIFDEKDIELQANVIMITDGGLLQVGTEEQPFQHKAIITLHGHHRSRELPVYGTKVIAVRNGTLELHGKVVPLTWTKVATTASAGTSTLQLVGPVEWNVGDEIIIATTGNYNSQGENEKRIITAISANKTMLTVNSPLIASHFGVEETFNGTLIELRGEVGLLTHNVLVRGNRDPQWEQTNETCSDKNNSGSMSDQTCFVETDTKTDSSQFGVTILVHASVKDSQIAVAKLSYIEVTFAGQAYRTGRYPIHFYLNGDMSSSYVRGISVHETFNRALSIHGVHRTLVEKCVIYNVMGSAVILEDGIETNNTLRENLIVFVKESTSLLNNDITQAAFLITNPDNVVMSNAVAGSTHFAYWYRLSENPDGPSYTPSVRPVYVPLGVFQNNSAHSCGWYGLWIFPKYFPTTCSCSSCFNVQPAVFRNLTAWNNRKGAESVNTGGVQFEGFVLIQNKFAGCEFKKVSNVPLYTDNSPMVRDSVIVGTTTVAHDSIQGCTDGGIVLPDGAGFSVKNVRFINFATDCWAFTTTRITGRCSSFCGGYRYEIEGVSFVNSSKKVRLENEWEALLVDKDGNLTEKGESEWKVLPFSHTLPTDCEKAVEFSAGVQVSICPPKYNFHHFHIRNLSPYWGTSFYIQNRYGKSYIPYGNEPLGFGGGGREWMSLFIGQEIYKIGFENSPRITNISFNVDIYQFETNSHILLAMNLTHFPDRVRSNYRFVNATQGGMDTASASNGDWEWDNDGNEIRVLVRQPSLVTCDSQTFYFEAYKCYYKDCVPPPDPDTIPPNPHRPPVFKFWDDENLWSKNTDGYIDTSSGSYGVPQDYDNVRIESDMWVVVKSNISVLGNLVLKGVLEFTATNESVYVISANNIIIMGGRLIIGWPDSPFPGQADIILRGTRATPDFVAEGNGPVIGSKTIGVFGGLDLFGRDVGVTWTVLKETASVGNTHIVLSRNVTWVPGDEIVVGPTHSHPWKTETFQIISVSEDGFLVTLNDSLKYDYIVYKESFPNGQSVDVATPVGLLTRNIRIIGEDYPKMYEQRFGARVLVGVYNTHAQTYTGYARLSNVEFFHTGQRFDDRSSVAYNGVGKVSNVKPSYISKCAFHNGFHSAIDASVIAGLNITDNVVHDVAGDAIVTSSADTTVSNNMVSLIQGAGIKATGAARLILRDNLITASSGVGYYVPPLPCTYSSNYISNMAYNNRIGLAYSPDSTFLYSCAEYTGFKLWNNIELGIYYQQTSSMRLRNNILVDNKHGIWTGIVGPTALSHIIGSKTAEIRDSLIIGRSPFSKCVHDSAASTQTGDRYGVLFPNFMSESIPAPGTNIESYNAIAGLMKLYNVTFAHFGLSSCGRDYAVATNIGNDDGQHPVELEKISVHDVQHESMVFYHRPNIGKINPSDCVDMDCDGLKKALLKDLDGTFLGHIGAVIPQSEFEWGTNPKRGLGNYRIPKEMVTSLNGTRIPYDKIAPNKGIIRNDNCTYRPSWQAYECGKELNYEMLIIESMDTDTETKRISPVAILGEGYIDLINGPQDHTWCTSYPCRRRISTFMALVATGHEYLMHFTGTTPFHMRYTLLNTQSEAIKLTVWYSRPNRLDVYVRGRLIMATNARITDKGFYVIDMQAGDEYEPKLSNATGTNKMDQERGELTIIIRGSTPVEVVTKPAVIVSFGLPAMSVEDFYGANIVENIAAFLKIPPNKVRVVNIVSEKSGSNRQKRSDEGIKITIEIGDEPSNDVNGTVPDSLEVHDLQKVAAEVVNVCQLGDLESSLGVNGSCGTINVPVVNASTTTVIKSITKPQRLAFTVEAEPSYVNAPLKTHPKVQAIDIQSDIVETLGTKEDPWQLKASIRPGTGHPDAVLTGRPLIGASEGWFNFTELVISHVGVGYILDFHVTYPDAARNFSLSSGALDISWPLLTAHVVSKTSGNILQNSNFSIGLDLRESRTGTVFENIGWQNHTWHAEVDMLGNWEYGELTGELTADFNATTGRVDFHDLRVNGFGFFYVKFRVYSDPPQYDFTLNERVRIMNPVHVGKVPETQKRIKLRFDVDYDKVLPSKDKENEFEQMILSTFANTWSTVNIKSGSIGKGSIEVTLVVEGSRADVNAVASSMCESITNSTVYTFNNHTLSLDSYLKVDDASFCPGLTPVTPVKTSEGINTLVIAIVASVSLVIVIVVMIVVCKHCCGKTKKHYDVHSDTTRIHRDDQEMHQKGPLFPYDNVASQPSSTDITAATDPPSERTTKRDDEYLKKVE